jgi:hypothetical protein
MSHSTVQVSTTTYTIVQVDCDVATYTNFHSYCVHFFRSLCDEQLRRVTKGVTVSPQNRTRTIFCLLGQQLLQVQYTLYNRGFAADDKHNDQRRPVTLTLVHSFTPTSPDPSVNKTHYACPLLEDQHHNGVRWVHWHCRKSFAWSARSVCCQRLAVVSERKGGYDKRRSRLQMHQDERRQVPVRSCLSVHGQGLDWCVRGSWFRCCGWE